MLSSSSCPIRFTALLLLLFLSFSWLSCSRAEFLIRINDDGKAEVNRKETDGQAETETEGNENVDIDGLGEGDAGLAIMKSTSSTDQIAVGNTDDQEPPEGETETIRESVQKADSSEGAISLFSPLGTEEYLNDFPYGYGPEVEIHRAASSEGELDPGLWSHVANIPLTKETVRNAKEGDPNSLYILGMKRLLAISAPSQSDPSLLFSLSPFSPSSTSSHRLSEFKSPFISRLFSASQSFIAVLPLGLGEYLEKSLVSLFRAADQAISPTDQSTADAKPTAGSPSDSERREPGSVTGQTGQKIEHASSGSIETGSSRSSGPKSVITLPRDFRKAVSHLSAAANAGHPYAQSVLGFLHNIGFAGVELNEIKAFAYHNFAANGGSMESKMALGYAFMRQQEFDLAAEMYADVAAKSVALNSFFISAPIVEAVRLSWAGEESWEARKGHKGEEDETLQFIEYTARKGNMHSLRTLGHLYYYGIRGIVRNFERARRYYQAASDLGDANSMLSLGEMYSRGLLTVSLKKEKGRKGFAEFSPDSDPSTLSSPFHESHVGNQKGSSDLKLSSLFRFLVNRVLGIGGNNEITREREGEERKEGDEETSKGEKSSQAGLGGGEREAEKQRGERARERRRREWEGYRRAMDLFKAAVQMKHNSGHNGIGYLYAKGKGVEQDWEKAFKHFQLAAEVEDADAYYNLGMMYLHGVDTRRPSKNQISELPLPSQPAYPDLHPHTHPHSHSRPQTATQRTSTGGAGDSHGSSRINPRRGVQPVGDGSPHPFDPPQMDPHPLSPRPAGAAFVVQRDPSKALQYFSMGKDRSHLGCMYQMARMLQKGIGTKQNDQTAAQLFKAVAERGPWGNMLRWAHECYMKGTSFSNPLKSLKIFSRDAQSSASSLSLSSSLSSSYFMTCSVLLYARAAELGYEVAQSNAAWILEKTKIHSLDEGLLPVPAVSEVSEKCEPGEAGQTCRSNLLESKDREKERQGESRGVDVLFGGSKEERVREEERKRREMRYVRAHKLLKHSSEQGNYLGSLVVGDAYFFGKGTRQSYPNAMVSYERARSFRSAQATFNIARMYELGLGVPQDFHLAKRYYDWALETESSAFLPVKISLFILTLRREFPGSKLVEFIDALPGFLSPLFPHHLSPPSPFFSSLEQIADFDFLSLVLLLSVFLFSLLLLRQQRARARLREEGEGGERERERGGHFNSLLRFLGFINNNNGNNNNINDNLLQRGRVGREGNDARGGGVGGFNWRPWFLMLSLGYFFYFVFVQQHD